MLLTALVLAAAPLFPATVVGETDAAALIVPVEISAVAAEDPPPSNPFGPVQRNFRQELERLRRITADPEVQGIRLELSGAIDLVRALDVARELRALQDAGKKIVCYSEELTHGDLLLASFADLLIVPPSGMLILQAPAVEAFYLKELLAHIDAKVEVLHIGEYKTAFENLAGDAMSDAQREVLALLLEEFYGQMRDLIAEGRGISPEEVDAFFGHVLVSPREAAMGGLIDGVGYEDEFDVAMSELFAGPVQLDEDWGEEDALDLEALFSNPFALFGNLNRLLNSGQPDHPSEPHIAVVYATGMITSGESAIGFDGTPANMGSDTIVEALEAAGANDDVRAVILRVNSPGGSATASDMIWRAIQRVRQTKPVIASMGTVAGSGGYWISMGCDRIIAQPTTITGSIGVVSALPNLSGTLKDLGIKVEVVAHGPRAAEMTMLAEGPSAFLKDRITAWMETVYEDFLTKAAAGRGLEREALAKVAHGRVWTGRQALERGLVDALGGYQDAVALACELAELDPATTPVAELPYPRDIFELVEEMFQVRMDLQAASVLERVLSETPLPADVSSALRVLISPDPLLNVDRIQCVMPFLMRIR